MAKTLTTDTGQFALVPVWLLDPERRLSDRAIRLYAVLRAHADRNGATWPSIPTLARWTGCSERSVQRTLRELEEGGALVTVPRVSEDGDPTSNVYFLRSVPPENTPPVTPGVSPDTRGGVSPDGGTNSTTLGLNQEGNTLRPREPSGSAGRPSKATQDPRVRQVLRHYHERYREVMGHDPIIHGARDGALIRRIPPSYSAEEIQRVLDAWVRHRDDKWVWGNGDIPSFVRSFNRLVSEGALRRREEREDGLAWVREELRRHGVAD